MATSDLYTELQKETLRMDADTEKRVCKMVVQKMQDSAGEISEIAVKWYDGTALMKTHFDDFSLSALLPKVQESNLIEILTTLLTSFLNENEQDGREMANLGLKTVIESIPCHSSAGKSVIHHFTPFLIQGMKSKAKSCFGNSRMSVGFTE